MTPRMTAVGCIAVAIASNATASTTPVRSDGPEVSVDQADLANPIYSHLSTADPSELPLLSVGDSATPEQWLALFTDRHSAMDYPAAVEAALRLTQAAPDRPHGYYNLACALCRLRRLDEAVTALNQAIDVGWRDLRYLSMDSDLAAMRTSDGYRHAIHRLTTLLAQEKLPPTPLREDDWSSVVTEIKAQAPAILQAQHVTIASVALIREGNLVWHGEFANGGIVQDEPGEVARAPRYRLRRPIEVMGLIAGAQLQRQGRLMLAQVLEQGAELERATRGRPGPGASPRSEPPTLSITPVRRRETRTTGSESSPDFSSRIDPQNATMSLLRLAIEIVSGQSFADYCRSNVMLPLGMADSTFDRSADDVQTLVNGHTPLGTIVPCDQLPDGTPEASVMYTSAADLGLLIEAMLRADHGEEAAPSTNADPIDMLARVNLLAPRDAASNAGLGVEVQPLSTGRRVQVFEITDGVGCLMRWYPRTRSGIVVLFDSAIGGPAAMRLAHLALGGE
jgi:hypothetical protein